MRVIPHVRSIARSMKKELGGNYEFDQYKKWDLSNYHSFESTSYHLGYDIIAYRRRSVFYNKYITKTLHCRSFIASYSEFLADEDGLKSRLREEVDSFIREIEVLNSRFASEMFDFVKTPQNFSLLVDTLRDYRARPGRVRI